MLQGFQLPFHIMTNGNLEAAHTGRDTAQVGAEIAAHLTGMVGASVRVTLEIEADIRDGASENVVRIATENGSTLKFSSSSGFEVE